MIHSPLPVAYLEGGVALRKLLCRRLILAASSLNSTGVSSRYRAWRVFSQRQVLVEVKGDISQADSKNYCGQAGTDYFKMNRGAFLCFVKVLRGYGTTTHSKETLQFVLEGHRASWQTAAASGGRLNTLELKRDEGMLCEAIAAGDYLFLVATFRPVGPGWARLFLSPSPILEHFASHVNCIYMNVRAYLL